MNVSLSVSFKCKVKVRESNNALRVLTAVPGPCPVENTQTGSLSGPVGMILAARCSADNPVF